MTHDELRQAAVDALAAVADQLPEAPPGVKVDPADRLVVRSSLVRGALECPAAFALDGETPFDERAALAGWSAAATVTELLARGHLDPSRGRPPTTPAVGFRTAWNDRAQLKWPWPWLDEADAADRALTAAEVHRRVAGLARGLGQWPPVGVHHVGHRPRWTFPSRPLQLDGRVDLVLGKRDGSHTLVVGLGGDHGSVTRARLAYEAVVEALALHRPPAAVLGVLADAGRRWHLPVTDDLLAEGVGAAAVAARAGLGARRGAAGGLERRVGVRCGRCQHVSGCGPGTTWLAGPGRLRAGFLPSV